MCVFLAVFLAFAISFFMTPAVIKFAFKVGALDKPDSRKVHKEIKPRMGGVAVYLAFAIPVCILYGSNTEVMGLLLGGLFIVLLGIFDDIFGMPARLKLLGQIAVATLVLFFGIKIDFITNPLSDDIIYLGILSIPLTIFWIVAVINAINLIDGLDGLASGISIIAAITISAVALREGSALGNSEILNVAVIALILAFATFGFLKYNFYPAKIFLGDTGSMFLGYCLAVLSIIGATKSAAAIPVFIPMVILGIPLLDTFFAIVRRCYQGRPVFKPDKEHVHHCLMELGLSHKQTVLVIYGISMFMGISAYVLNLVTTDRAILILAVLSVMIIVAAEKIGIIGHKNNIADADVKTRGKK